MDSSYPALAGTRAKSAVRARQKIDWQNGGRAARAKPDERFTDVALSLYRV
jgi:hypothetical protein